MLLHVKDPSQSDMKKVLIFTADTDVVAIPIGVLEQLDFSRLCLEIEIGKYLKYLVIQIKVTALKPENSKCLSLFHTFTGCDQVFYLAHSGKTST